MILTLSSAEIVFLLAREYPRFGFRANLFNNVS